MTALFFLAPHSHPGTSHTMLSRSGGRWHSCCVTEFMGKVFCFLALHKTLAVDFP